MFNYPGYGTSGTPISNGAPRPVLYNAQTGGQFLDQHLNRVRYTNRPKVKQDILDILPGTSSLGTLWNLVPKVATHVSNDGNTFQLVMLEGTVQITYMNANYNIPVEIVIPEGYPLVPPIAYVRPTPTMEVKPGHSYIDANGHVNSLPYVRQWNSTPERCNLRELCTQMSTLFSAEPPLFSRPQHSIRTASAERVSLGSNGGSSRATSATGAKDERNPPASKKMQLIAQITEHLQKELDKSYDKLIREKEMEEDSQEVLRRSQKLVEEKIRVGKKDLSRIRELTLDIANEKRPMLEKWFAERGAQQSERPDFNSYIFAYDDLSEQIVALQAEEKAYEDAIKCLEEAFDKKQILLRTFLLETRELASCQFVNRVHLTKIRAELQKG